MGETTDTGATGQDAFVASLNAKFAAVADESAATEETPTTTSKPAEASDETVESGDEAADSGQPSPAKEDDPWAELKSKFTPAQLREKLELAEKAAEIEANAKEMRRQASLRGEQTGRERAEISELSRKVEEQLARNAGLVDMAAQVADENPEFAQQLLRVVGGRQPATDGNAANGRAPLRAGTAIDPEVLNMRKELEALKAQSNQVAFGVSHAKVQEIAMDVATRHPLLQKAHVQKLGIPEKVIRGAIEAVYRKDREEGGSINPWDPVALRAAVTAAVAAEIKPYEDFGREEVTAWRAARKAINATAPPSSKGATAGVRSAPNFSEPPPRSGNPEDFQNHLKKKFLQASQPVRPAE